MPYLKVSVPDGEYCRVQNKNFVVEIDCPFLHIDDEMGGNGSCQRFNADCIEEDERVVWFYKYKKCPACLAACAEAEKRISWDDAVEKLASIAHEAWSGWMRYLIDRCAICPDGGRNISPTMVDRYLKQMDTLYKDLSESEKKSDRKEAIKYLQALGWEKPEVKKDG